MGLAESVGTDVPLAAMSERSPPAGCWSFDIVARFISLAEWMWLGDVMQHYKSFDDDRS